MLYRYILLPVQHFRGIYSCGKAPFRVIIYVSRAQNHIGINPPYTNDLENFRFWRPLPGHPPTF